MAEAVFSIAAEITPQLNERDLERQANAIAGQLNGILAKQVSKVGIQAESGGFRPFQQELAKSKGVLDRFQGSLLQIPRTLNTVARSGRSAFLKFTDAINVTRREIVGFGGGIRDSIRNTNLFENALDEIRSAGSSLADLPSHFEVLSAQVQSGTTYIDQMAARGSQMALMFQPLQQQGEAARVEFTEMNESLEQVALALNRLASEKGISTVVDEFDLLNQDIRALQQPFYRVQAILNDTGTSATEFGKELRRVFEVAGRDPDQLAAGLILMRDEAQKTAGPMGLLAQMLGRVTAEERAAAKAARLELNASLIELGRGDQVVGIQKIATQFALLREKVTGFANFFAPVTREIQKFGSQGMASIVSIGDSISNKLIGLLPQFRNEALSAEEAMNKFVLGMSNTEIAAARIQKAMNNAANYMGNFARAFVIEPITSKLSALGGFLTKNLVGPLKAAGPQIRQAFGSLGKDVANGLGFGSVLKSEAEKMGVNVVKGVAVGISKERASIVTAADKFKTDTINNMNNVFGIASAAKKMIPTGKNIVEGVAKGVADNTGILKRALAGLGQVALTAINPFKMAGLAIKGLKAGFDIVKPAITAAGVALAGFVTTAAVTGIQFNTLKQVINATLPVVLGSASASRELLAQVNELNDSSPFARDSFLELTKVLAGFGVEATKITPLIDAIQQSVAATGGGEQDLLELGQAFAKIQTQGRLTSESLQSFSVRGIDVISLLGDSMGKTTGEIKGMISDGLIPARLALDTLTTALKTKFDGATDAVSKNFPGAMDRMKAKIRDFGGILTAAFVSPEGGGALVDLLNSLSSALGHINKEILPAFRDSLESVANNLSKGAKAVETFVKGISGNAVADFAGQLGGLMPIFAGVLGFLPGLASGLPVVGELIAGIGGWPLALGLVLATMEPVREAFGELIKTLAPAIKDLLPKMSELFATISDAIGPLIAMLIGALGPILKEIFNGFAVLSEALKPIIEYFGRLFIALEPVVNIIKTVIIIAIKNMIGQFRIVLAILDPIIKKIVELAEELKPAAEEVARFLQELVDSGQIEAFFDTIVGAVKMAVQAIQPFLDTIITIKNALKFIGIDIGSFKLPTIDKATDKWVGEMEDSSSELNQVFLASFKRLDTNEAFQSLFGHLEPGFRATAAHGIETYAAEFDTGVNDLLDIMTKKDFKGVFGKLAPAMQAKTAGMLEQFNDGGDKVLAILNEKDFRKAFKTLEPAVQIAKANIIQSGRDIQAMYDGAKKSVETLTKSIGESADAFRQAIDTAAGVIDGMITASKAVASAQAAVGAAREKESEATANLTQLQKDYARAIEDTIKPADELGVAERNLTRIKKSLTDLTREEIRVGKDNAKLRKELADLQGEEANEDRAALARSEERAQIALNRAKQAELDLLDELNGKQKISLNLAGLSLDQIRAKLAAARLSAKGASTERDKTPEEIADLKRSAQLDVEDARAALDSAQEARGRFEIETNERIEEIRDNIRDNDERIQEIAADRLDILLDEQSAIKEIGRLRNGENAIQQTIKDWDDKINAAKDVQKKASQDIETAVRNAAIEQATFRLKTAESKGDADAILKAHQDLWRLQTAGDGQIYQAGVLRDIMGKQLSNVEKARDAARELKDELAAANKILGAAGALQGASGSLGSYEALNARVAADLAGDKPMNPITLSNLTKTKNDFFSSMRAALGQGGAENKTTKLPALLNPSQIESIIQEIAKEPGNLRDAVARILNRWNLSMPGFAAAHGYAPGDLINSGMNNGVGLMRWAEFGKEAILPLTRKLDMARVVNNPQVLPAILDALPRWAMPANELKANEADLNDRAQRLRGQRANAEVYNKKNQREFADQIGSAVYTAVKTALAESESRGADVDINVMPSTANEILIARQVKREVQKALGKGW